MRFIDSVRADRCTVTPQHIFLRSGLEHDVNNAGDSEQAMRELAQKALVFMGLDSVLEPREVIQKPHHFVADRDAAVAEQFYHADVAFNGFAAIILLGIAGTDPERTPPTQMINNQAMVRFVSNHVADTKLDGRLDEIKVVRPYLDPEDGSAWADYPRHVLTRFPGSRLSGFLSEDQRRHVQRDAAKVKDRSRYEGDIFLSNLVTKSLIDGSEMLACGLGSREIRLSLGPDQAKDEGELLKDLHDTIAYYLLSVFAERSEERVVKGSALLVPVDQLHRATPYDEDNHFRSVVAVKAYPKVGQVVPRSWAKASGLEY